MDENKKTLAAVDDLKDIMEYDIFDEEIKNKMVNNSKLNKKITKWLGENNNSWTKAVKNCYVEYIDYESLDFENMDEFEIKSANRKIKKNKAECPNHMNCQMFQNNLIKPGMKCPLETLECYNQTSKLYEELKIKEEDINDQILLSQMVGLQLVFNRSMVGLANSPLVEPVKKITNGGVTYDTKINENYNIAKSVLSSIESLRKSLILNRDDKIKIKNINTKKTMDAVKQNAIEIINHQEENLDLTEMVSVLEKEVKNNKKEEDSKKEASEIRQIKDIDA